MPIVAVATLITLILSAGLVTTGELLRASAGAPALPAGETRFEPKVDLAARTRAALAGRSADAPSAAPEPEKTARLLSGVPLKNVDDVAQRLRTNVALGHGVAVFAATAGTPTTAPALALARALAGDAKVVLVSLVPDAAAGEALGVESGATGLADVVRRTVSFGQAIRRDKGSRVHLVAFGRPDVGIDAILDSRRFQTMIGALAKAYDHVVVDAGDAGSGARHLAAIALRVVVIASPDAQDEAAAASRMLVGAGFADIAVMTPAAGGEPHDLVAA